ncbi:hypothetical protein tinsulaeT_06310 [Thalassotalea insulae]|uniref:Uncharacterized protein n=1 Tax=Thalassotalea insulae TaxID=2056778 RepID=A0ABQ6GN38_9GAMM|nr:hypothetical protein [Thalassotalea insulae]GLX77291.1 hypothetical protein tinsulaeT_06310 [Thalassotalea insulae]
MDVLAELLPPSYLVKSENTAKDKKQRSRHYRKNASQYSQNDQELAVKSSHAEQNTNWDQVDRRSGKDRRHNNKCRGRWLESRAEKDRRQQSKAIEIKI